VFEMMGAGLTNAEIASRLSIGNRTVETHRHNIMGKLGIDSASGLIRTAPQYDDIHSGIPAGPSTA
jgi:two-component system NarL family response regulator